MTTPFFLHVFVADGDPDGLRIVERSNWIGKAVVFPRVLLQEKQGWRMSANLFEVANGIDCQS